MRFVFKASREEIVNATSLQDVKTSMADEYKKMSNLVIRVGVRRMVYETMGMFMNMTDEIRLR
ncbi:Protein CBG17621 [Caenorhabditis briggsae]|nr:Protein CBG17621 [Caenorhabditis briggsae]CAP35314.2 Protein CBG17621 [Caenorhabditis briggsae]